MVTWIALEIAPIFNHTVPSDSRHHLKSQCVMQGNSQGQKALDSIPVVVLVAFVMSALVLAVGQFLNGIPAFHKYFSFQVFREAVNSAACAAVILWSKAASDVLWCNAINSVSP